MSPNNKLAGEKLVTSLSTLSNSKTIAFIAGTRSIVNNHRVDGAMIEAEKLNLHIVPPVYTDWTKNDSISATQILLQMISNIDFMWTAGPEIADGAIEVLSRVDSDTLCRLIAFVHSAFFLVRVTTTLLLVALGYLYLWNEVWGSVRISFFCGTFGTAGHTYSTAYLSILGAQVYSVSQAVLCSPLGVPSEAVHIDMSECVLNGGWEQLEQGKVDLLLGSLGLAPSQKGYRPGAKK